MSHQLHLQTKLIAIKRIDCPHSIEYFGYIEPQIERGAKLFLEAKGIINPLVVKNTNNIINGVAIDDFTPDGRYEVISGFLEYFCAVRARQINPFQECVQAIILSNQLADNLVKQIEFFRIGAETIEPDSFWGEDDDLDFVLEEEPDRIDSLIDKALEGKSVESCFAAAERLCNLYPDPQDLQAAIAELESIKDRASGDRTYRTRLDSFFAEAGGIYE